MEPCDEYYTISVADATVQCDPSDESDEMVEVEPLGQAPQIWAASDAKPVAHISEGSTVCPENASLPHVSPPSDDEDDHIDGLESPPDSVSELGGGVVASSRIVADAAAVDDPASRDGLRILGEDSTGTVAEAIGEAVTLVPERMAKTDPYGWHECADIRFVDRWFA